MVDNNSTDDTKQVVRLAAQAGLPVHRVIEKKVGFPYVYNRGLHEAMASDWICFIDDDCVADPDWYRALQIGINHHSDAAALLGYSLTQIPTNIWSVATWSLDQIWKQQGLQLMAVGTKTASMQQLKDQPIIDLEVLDNKNIAYRTAFLQQHQIKFNEQAVIEDGVGAAEDADLGMQLAQAGGAAWFLPQMQVKHQDPTNAMWFFKKVSASAQAIWWYRRRWQQRIQVKTSTQSLRRRGRLQQQWQLSRKYYHLSWWQAGQLLIILLSAVLVTNSIQMAAALRWRVAKK